MPNARPLHRRKGFEHRSVLPLPYRGEGAPVSAAAADFGRGRQHPDTQVSWTIACSRPPWWCPSSTIFRSRCRAINWYSTRSAMRIWPLRRCKAAQSLAALSGAPLLNAPAAVLATGRSDNARAASTPGGSDRAGNGHIVARGAELGRCRNYAGAPWSCAFRCCCARRVFTPGAILCAWSAPERWPMPWLRLPGAELTAIQYLDSRGPTARFASTAS
jgi:hypothetical protein